MTASITEVLRRTIADTLTTTDTLVAIGRTLPRSVLDSGGVSAPPLPSFLLGAAM